MCSLRLAAYTVSAQLSQSVSQLFHGPAPRSPLHRLAVRLRHSRSNTSTEYWQHSHHADARALQLPPNVQIVEFGIISRAAVYSVMPTE